MATSRALVVGAGIGGLAAAVELAAAGLSVTVLERGDRPGGKLRTVETAAGPVDVGPADLVQLPVIEALFAAGGSTLEAHLAVRPLTVILRHAWPDGSSLDLHADAGAAEEAIAAFAGRGDALRYREFVRAARQVHDALERSYTDPDSSGLPPLLRSAGLKGLPGLTALRPFNSLRRALETIFADERLRQAFGRYATRTGSSPFAAPAAVMLAAHVEAAGVYAVEGGTARLAGAIAGLAGALGATLRCGAAAAEIVVRGGRAVAVRLAGGEEIPADAVVFNGDAAALGAGLLGTAVTAAGPSMPRVARSLSAVTWAMAARVAGARLARRTVFFSGDDAAEFEALFRFRRLADRPTVHVSAPDRDDDGDLPPGGAGARGERLFIHVHAPADGDARPLEPQEIARCESTTFAILRRTGLSVEPVSTTVTTPADYARMYPATGGALYGRATHGWAGAFSRPGPRTPVRGLYLCGGSAHPGPGLSMAALSGRLAAQALIRDLGSTGP